MKKSLFVCLLLIISLATMAQKSNNRYEKDWERVETFENNSQPTSASEVVDKILKQAITDKNHQQVVKSLIFKNKYKLEIDNSEQHELINDLISFANDMRAKNIDEIDKYIIHSMIAELYNQYYQQNQYRINRLTNLEVAPKDMKEWSKNIFFDKITEQLNLSTQSPEVLKKHTSTEYPDLILSGSESKEYYPTLYDFLMYRSLEIAKEVASSQRNSSDLRTSTGFTANQLSVPAKEFIRLPIKETSDGRNILLTRYQSYMSDLLNRNMIPTLVLIERNKLNDLSILSNKYGSEELIKEYETILNVKEYDNSPTTVDITYEICNRLSNKANNNKSKADVVSFAQRYIDKFPNYARTYLLKGVISDLEMSSLKIEGDRLYYPNQDAIVNIIHKNIQSLGQASGFILCKLDDNGEKFKHIKDFSPSLISASKYSEDTLKMNIGSLDIGKYQLAYIRNMRTFESIDAKMNNADSLGNATTFVVSALTSFNRTSGKDEYEIFVVDRKTGKPISDASVNITQTIRENNQPKEVVTSLTTNPLGLVTFKDQLSEKKGIRYNSGIKYKVTLEKDSASEPVWLYSNEYYSYTNDQNPKRTISIFTDRSIYRPAQTVYFKAISIGNSGTIEADKPLTAILNNPRGEEINKIELRTNEFGSIAGNFILPSNGLLGDYTIKVDDQYISFSVEEYKRPTFEITFEDTKDSFAFGDRIAIKGNAKSFSGINLQNADVIYYITRQNGLRYPFWGWGGSKDHFENGEVTTDNNGNFTITFTADEGDNTGTSFLRKDPRIKTFEITATISDSNGETQSNTYSLSVGNTSMIFNIDIPAQIEKTDSSKISITAANLKGLKIDTKGTYKLYTLNEKDSVQNEVLSGSFATGEQKELKERLKKLASGKYQLQVTASDDKGREVNGSGNFVLYSYNDKKPPVKTNAWFVVKNDTFSKKQPAEVIFGTSEKDCYILYQVYNKDQVFERKHIRLSEANQTFKIPYKDEYDESVSISFISVRDNKFTNKDAQLKLDTQVSDDKLNIKLEVFRDKLRPGENERWTIRTTDSKGQSTLAELLASMYDIALDKIRPHNPWELNKPFDPKDMVYLHNYNYTTSWTNMHQYLNLGIDNEKDVSYGNIDLDQINWHGYSLNFYSDMVVKGYAPRSKRMAVGSVSAINLSGTSNNHIEQEAAMVMEDQSTDAGTSAGVGAQQEPKPQIRQNFNETAFFFPQLRTDEKGETLISFTVPETNTTWRFRIFAHDKNLRAGTSDNMVVTQKELMITPNMPRFIRQGDKTSIATKISNLSDKTIAGDVRIEFFDPTTDKPIDLKVANPTQTFSLEQGASTSASWTFDVPINIDLIGCRIVAKNENFSDGEQHALAVLPNRILVTESMPFDINQTGETTFTFDKLATNQSSSLSNYKLTLEYADNPAWYAVLALPTMSNPTNENAVNWFASYYVNSLGTSLMRQYPKVSAMIKAWKAKGENSNTMLSKLQKNDDLKNVLLEETPWVLDAKNETEQMQRLSLLFDLNNTQALTSTAIEKLNELQAPEGGWAWYNGMRANRSVTQYILYGLSKLQTTGQIEYPSEVKEMQMSALKYLDKQLSEDLASLKKGNKAWDKITQISVNQLEYLYVRSFYRDIPITQEARDAERFYTSVVSKNWTKLGLYEKSILSVLLKENGDKTLAGQIAKSIKEHAKVDNKLGMYWPNLKNHAFLSMSAVSQHTFLMEALKENGATTVEMNKMKTWLVKQKQTQVWESTHASIDAINTLLQGGSDWFSGEKSSTQIKVGSKSVDTNQSELGSGYIKTAWNASDINKGMANVSVSKTSETPAYGALYWQYFEDLNKVQSQGGDLSVNKQLFKKEINSQGEVLIPITENSPIKVGDQVVIRLTVRSDRDMEFVHLKDMRAACFEPTQTLSGTNWNNGVLYYETTKDASTNYFIDFLPKGTYVLEYRVYANRSGEYANGITSIQCLYSPDFISHTAGIKVVVKD